MIPVLSLVLLWTVAQAPSAPLPPTDQEIVVELSRDEDGLSVDGRELPGLPPSARAVLSETHTAGHLGTVAYHVIGG